MRVFILAALILTAAGETDHGRALLDRPVTLDAWRLTVPEIIEQIRPQLGADDWRILVVGAARPTPEEDDLSTGQLTLVRSSLLHLSPPPPQPILTVRSMGTLRELLDDLVARTGGRTRWRANRNGVFIDWPAAAQGGQRQEDVWYDLTCDLDLPRPVLIGVDAKNRKALERLVDMVDRRRFSGQRPELSFLPIVACHPDVPFAWDRRRLCEAHAFADDAEVRAAMATAIDWLAASEPMGPVERAGEVLDVCCFAGVCLGLEGMADRLRRLCQGPRLTIGLALALASLGDPADGELLVAVGRRLDRLGWILRVWGLDPPKSFRDDVLKECAQVLSGPALNPVPYSLQLATELPALHQDYLSLLRAHLAPESPWRDRVLRGLLRLGSEQERREALVLLLDRHPAGSPVRQQLVDNPFFCQLVEALPVLVEALRPGPLGEPVYLQDAKLREPADKAVLALVRLAARVGPAPLVEAARSEADPVRYAGLLCALCLPADEIETARRLLSLEPPADRLWHRDRYFRELAQTRRPETAARVKDAASDPALSEAQRQPARRWLPFLREPGGP